MKRIPRRPDVSTRVVRVGLFGRFSDELLFGLFMALLPTFRRTFGLTLTQVGLLLNVLEYVALFVEPIASLLNDVWQRKWIMAFGAVMCGLSVITMGAAPTFAVLIVGFALYGAGSGPLAHSADILLVDAHPDAPDLIFNRSTIIDTVGAFIAPLLIPIGLFFGLSWRSLLILVGIYALLYGLIIGRTRFPPPGSGQPEADAADEAPLLKALADNVRTVLADKPARLWLVFLLCLSIIDLPLYQMPIWLAESGGMSQSLVGTYIAVESAIAFVALLLLERWRSRLAPVRIMQVALVLLLILYPIWFALPGNAARFLLAVPINLAFPLLWPIAKGQSLASVPGKAGAISAINATFGILPLQLAFGFLSDQVGLTTMMVACFMAGLALLLALSFTLPTQSSVTPASS